MKKSTKLLSILLAIVMVFSTMSIAASAKPDSWSNLRTGENGNKLYSINDQALASHLTDEERAAWVCDMLDDLLENAGLPEIHQSAAGANIDIVLSSLNGIFDTLRQVDGKITAVGGLVSLDVSEALGGVINDLSLGMVHDGDRSFTRESDGDWFMLDRLLQLIDANCEKLTIGSKGLFSENGLDLGDLVSGMLPASIQPVLKDLTGLLREMIYGAMNTGAPALEGINENSPLDDVLKALLKREIKKAIELATPEEGITAGEIETINELVENIYGYYDDPSFTTVGDSLYQAVNRLAPFLFDKFGDRAINNGEWGLKKLLKDVCAGEPIGRQLNENYEVGNWASIWPGAYDPTADDTDIIANLNGILDKIIDVIFSKTDPDAAYVVKEQWSADKTLTQNVTDLVRYILDSSWNNIFFEMEKPELAGKSLEDLIVLLGIYYAPKLIPALVLPHSYTYKMDADANAPESLEEGIVYCIREFVAEILPGQSWDGVIANAKALTKRADRDDAFLNIALDMGLSIAHYYLHETIGMSSIDLAPMTALDDAKWKGKLSSVIDFLLADKFAVPDYGWVAGLLKPVKTAVSGAGDGLAKLGAIFDKLVPGLLKFLNGCESGGQFDASLLLGKLKNLLNGDLDSIVGLLARHANDVGDAKLIPAVISVVCDLFGATSLSASNDFGALRDELNAAAAPDAGNPLDNLINRDTLGKIAKQLLWVLSDNAGSGDWLPDLLAIVIQAMGALNSLDYSGTELQISPYYFVASGSDVEIEPQIKPLIKGFADGYGDPAYATAASQFEQYSKFTVRYVSAEVLDEDGAVKASDNAAAALTPNEFNTLNKLTFTPPASRQLYRLKVTLEVTATIDGSTVGNFIVTKAFATGGGAYASDEGEFELINASSYILKGYNCYLDETDPLSNAESAMLSFSYTGAGNRAQNYGTIDIDGLSPMPPKHNTDGSVNQTCNPTGNVQWQVSVNQNIGQGLTTDFGMAINAGVSSTLTNPTVPFYFNWDSSLKSYNYKIKVFSIDCVPMQCDANGAQQWMSDRSVTRADYDADFVGFKFQSNQFRGLKGGKNPKKLSMKANPHIFLYNSYGMNDLVEQEMALARDKNAYTGDWNAYKTALNDALALYYMDRNPADFIGNRQDDNGVSKYPARAEALRAAIEGLTPIDTQSERLTGLNNKLAGKPAHSIRDYLLYRWNIYNNKLVQLQTLADSCVPPTALTADMTYLPGIPDDRVDAALAEPGLAAYAGYYEQLETHPTQADIDARNTAIANFKAPVLDNKLPFEYAKLDAYETRLRPKAPELQYLSNNNDVEGALEVVAGAVSNGESFYTPESWAEFNTRLADANAITAASKPNEIFDARYYLLVAYKALVPVTQELDMTAMDEKIAMAQDIFATPDGYEFTAPPDNPNLTEEQAKQALFEALGYKTAAGDYLGGGATAVAQADKKGLIAQNTAEAVEFSDSEAALAKALEPFTPVAKDPELIGLEAKDANDVLLGTGQVCKDYNSGKYIYGVAPGTTAEADLNKFFGATNDGSLEWVAPEGVTLGGTGTIVKLKNSRGEYVKGEEYTLILFGDVDGSASITGTDVGMVKRAADNIAGAIPTAAGMLAADVDASASITGTDVGMVKRAADNIAGAIDQNIGFPPAA